MLSIAAASQPLPWPERTITQPIPMRFPCPPVPRIPKPRVTYLRSATAGDPAIDRGPRAIDSRSIDDRTPCPRLGLPWDPSLDRDTAPAALSPQPTSPRGPQPPRSVRTWGTSLLLGLLTWGGLALPSLGQTAPGVLPACAPPAPGEYLLLVLTPDPATQESLRQSLPPSVSVPACDYLGNTVSRMGGFRNPEDASAWADYIKEVASLQSFVARPSDNSPSAPPTPPSSAPSPRTFTPQALGAGYAVLVDYSNDPVVAQRLRQARQQTPGLASFGQRPYLLAFYTADSTIALTLLADLSRQGFKALVVDAPSVVVLTDQVKGLP